MLKQVIVVGFLFALGGLAQSSHVSSARIAVDVRPEAALAWQGNNTVLVKVRLAPGMQVSVWAGESCASPTVDSAQVVSASGTVAIDIATLGGAGKPLVCLSSSDGRLTASLAALHN
jgi:hypothetical protein